MNIYDIAKEAGVSISTVSRVLNNHPNVKKQTKENVLSVLKKSNYIPSSVAKSLVNKATKTIGVLASDIRHIHYANIAFTIEQKLSTYGYNVILCNTGNDKSKMKDYLRVLAEKQVDGVIMVGSIFSCDQTAESIQRYHSNTPVVMHNTSLRGDNIYNISSEEAYGIVLAVDYLVQEKGIKDIALVLDYDTPVVYQKHEIYREKLEEYGIPYLKKRVVRTQSGLSGGVAAIEDLTKHGVDFSAVIGCDDITSVGAMQQLEKYGRRVPGDVAVIGFNNTLFSQVSTPAMTVIDNKEEITGIMLSRAMGDVLSGQPISPQTLIYPELILRGTT
ncbi:MAG: LacI family transcriptional regulator [Spirochaetaceae bacterium]|nr:LacI family transcriptional regulator [Spirochaetaceae bacterium]MCF7949248.1 LacI family transcriptional regulator [Spirochaetia bacterium]MCF7951635.1 LacI family transcriptional regulator [Spirochaetaceae bacterium]